jgi:hypothetical protein
MRMASFESCGGKWFDLFAGSCAIVAFGHSASTSESGRRPRAASERAKQRTTFWSPDPEE